MKKQPNGTICFVCGRENEQSLRAEYYTDTAKQLVVSDISIPARFNGWPGHAHGGLVAALLDEAAFRAMWIDGNYERAMVTQDLRVQMRRPTPTEQPLKTVGWVVEMNETRARTASEIRLPDGTVLARGQATLVKPPDRFLETRGWQEEKPNFKVYEDNN